MKENICRICVNKNIVCVDVPDAPRRIVTIVYPDKSVHNGIINIPINECNIRQNVVQKAIEALEVAQMRARQME